MIVPKELYFRFKFKLRFAAYIFIRPLKVILHKTIHPDTPAVIPSRMNFHTSLKNQKIRRICEIGVFEGKYSEYLLHKFKPEELWLIDPWLGNIKSGDQDGNNIKIIDGNKLYRMVSRLFQKIPAVKILRDKSEVLASFPDNYFDLIYIDGDHNYHTVSEDLSNCFRKVKPGGWITGHDYIPNPKIWHPHKQYQKFSEDIKHAVDEFCALRGLRIDILALDGCVSYAIYNGKLGIENFI